jgi:hypothetical protein
MPVPTRIQTRLMFTTYTIRKDAVTVSGSTAPCGPRAPFWFPNRSIRCTSAQSPRLWPRGHCIRTEYTNMLRVFHADVIWCCSSCTVVESRPTTAKIKLLGISSFPCDITQNPVIDVCMHKFPIKGSVLICNLRSLACCLNCLKFRTVGASS